MVREDNIKRGKRPGGPMGPNRGQRPGQNRFGSDGPDAAGKSKKTFRSNKLELNEAEINSSDYIEKVIAIKRVTKVNKGGKKLSFSALVVVGDTKGKVGFYLGKAGEVAVAIKKALLGAKKNMITVPLKGTTIPHQIIGECGAAQVLLKPASEGTGVIAAGPVRAVCDGAGIRNILTKCHKSNNPINVIKATFNGLCNLKIYREEQVAVQPQEEQKNATA